MTVVAAIGSVALDVVSGAPARPGGAVYYAARAFAHLGADARIVARCAARDEPALVPSLEAFGLPLAFRPGEHTTSFSFHYVGDHRVMEVTAIGDPWTPDDISGWAGQALGDAAWVQVGALLRSDFGTPTLEALAQGRRLLLDGQGLVRLARIGQLERDAAIEPGLLRTLTILKLNEDEARILAGGIEPDRLRSLDVPEVVLTLGSAGALLVTASHDERVSSLPVEGVVDPTGAGDSFSAGYLNARARGAEPTEAVRAAAAVAAEILAATAP